MKEGMNSKNIFLKIKNNLLFIVLLTFFSVVSTSIICFFVVSPVYQASTDIIIHHKGIEEEYLTKWNMDESIQFIPTYREIINSSLLLERVIDNLNLDLTVDQLREQIILTAVDESQVVKITVTNKDPNRAADIANNLVTLSQNEIKQLVYLDNIIVLTPAIVGEKVSGSTSSFFFSVTIAAVMALVCGVGFSLLIEYFDQTIKDEQDVLEVLNLPILGVISPLSDKGRIEKIQTTFLKNKEA